MGKFIFFITIAALIYWLIKKSQPKKSIPVKPVEDMVSCIHCSIHLPRSEAICSPDSKYFCCNEHRNRYINSKY